VPQTCSGSVISPYRVRSPRGLVALLVGLVLSVGVSLGAQAATTWTVCASGCDYASIKSAIAASTTLDGDTLAIAAGTYTEPGILVDKSLILQGSSATTTIARAAEAPDTAPDRVFTIPSGVTVTIQNLTIRHGRTRDSGGGVSNAGTLTLTHSIVSGNTVTYGWGGGLTNGGTLTLTHSTIRSNKTFGYLGLGGGLYNSGGTLTLTQSTISSNTADDGGGLYNYAGTLTLTQSTVSDNNAWGGGGLFNYRGTLTLINSTISDNDAELVGGLYSYGRTLTLTQSTVSGNAGGGVYNVHGTLTLTTSLVANNPDGGDCLKGSHGAMTTSHGYNLDSDGSCHLTAPTDLLGVDPLLGPLHDHGGPTRTHALLPGSPAIDAIPWGVNGCGTTVVSDQRWQARPQAVGGACDIGAYEVEVAGQPLSAWLTGVTLRTVICQNLTTGQEVTLSAPVPPWDCEAAGLAITSGDRVAVRLRGPVQREATDVEGAVVGMTPSRGSCTNLTTGQQVTLQYMGGATAASCGTAGLVMQPGEDVQMRVQGVAE
jgi:Right handed beta helix region